MKRSVRLRLICLCVAMAVLASALLVAAVTGSPYEVLKKSVFETLRLQNGTMNTSASLYVDGVLQEEVENFWQSDGANTLREASFESDDFYLYGMTEDSFYANRRDGANAGSSQNAMMYLGLDDREMRIMELAADLLVGDLKNNISMERVGEERHFAATVVESQIPELYALIMDLYASEATNYGYFSLAYNELISYDLDAMTAVMRDLWISGDTLRENVWSVYLYDENSENYEALVRNGYQSIEIEGKTYLCMHNEGLKWSETPISVEEAVSMMERSGKEALQSEFDIIQFVGIESLRFTYGHAEATVNDDNVFTSARMSLSFDLTDKRGKTCELAINFDGTIRDIGTTVVEPPCDLAELDRVLGDYESSRIVYREDGSLSCVEADYEALSPVLSGVVVGVDGSVYEDYEQRVNDKLKEIEEMKAGLENATKEEYEQQMEDSLQEIEKTKAELEKALKELEALRGESEAPDAEEAPDAVVEAPGE